MKLRADQSRCVGAAQCVLTEPALFDQDEQDGSVILLATDVDGDLLTAAREAMLTCPSGALSLEGE
jgi:ferredoxin